MKVHLTTVLVLGTIFAIGESQPANAAVIQPIVPTAQQDNLTEAYWHGRYHQRGIYHRWGGYPNYRHGYPCRTVCNHLGCFNTCL